MSLTIMILHIHESEIADSHLLPSALRTAVNSWHLLPKSISFQDRIRTQIQYVLIAL